MKKEIFNAAERLLANRAHSIHELSQKLLRKFPGENADIENCINYFEQSGIINDARFAHDYAEYILLHHPKGVFLLKQELMKKGIKEPLLSETISALDIDEQEIAKELADQKVRSLPTTLESEKVREKIYRFLLSRGFSFEISREVAKQIVKMDSADT